MSRIEVMNDLMDAEPDRLPLGFRNLKSKPGFRRKVLETLADGDWHTVAEISASLREAFPSATPKSARNTIDRLLNDPPKGQELVSRKIGNRSQYRLRKSSAQSRSVPTKQLNDFIEDFSILLDEIDRLGRQGRFEIAPETLRGIAHKMRALFIRLNKAF